jgi:monoamine oxidase
MAAAKELQRLEHDFLLLEASHRIGGRAYTEELITGIPFDLGAHWIMAPSVNPLMPLAERQLMRLVEADRHYTAARYFEDDAWLPDAAAREFGAYWDKQFDTLARVRNGGQDTSVLDSIDNNDRWAPYFYMFYAQDFTRDVDQASVLDTLNYVREENDLAVPDGLGNLLALYGENVPVSLNSAVRRIDCSKSKIVLDTTKGLIKAEKVILTVSTGVLSARQIEFVPNLPDWKLEAIDGLPLGSCTRVALMFAEPVLHDLPSEFTVDTSGDGPIHFRNRPFGRNYVEIAVGGRTAAWMEKSGQKATVAFILEKLRRVAGRQAVPHPVQQIVSAWDGDNCIRGAYSCARPGAADQRPLLACPIDNRLFFAGEATSRNYYASVNGACSSGREAARAATV